MTAQDIVRLEEALKLTIPQEYIEFVCSDENRQEFDMAKMAFPLPFDREAIERDNRSWRELPVVCDYWNPSWLSVFPDGMGNTYFITTDPYDGKIYDFDHEQTYPDYNPLARPAFQSLQALLDHVRAFAAPTPKVSFWKRLSNAFRA